MNDERIHKVTAIAKRRQGLIRGRDMRSIGVEATWIHRNMRAGWLERIAYDEYRIGPNTVQSRRRAAIDAGGDGSLLIGGHALAAWGLPTSGVDMSQIEVWTPTHRRARRGVRFRRFGWIVGGDGRSRDGLSIARRAVCIASAAWQIEAVDMVKLINEACFREPSVLKELMRIASSNRNLRGRRALWTAIDWYRAGHCGLDSKTEKIIRAELKRLGAPDPVVNPWLQLPDGTLRLDMYWPDAGLVLEVNPIGHKRDWVRNSDLGRIARLNPTPLEVISLDMTRSVAHRQRVLSSVAARAWVPTSAQLPRIVPPPGVD